jgi:hypothetical protein
MTFARTAVCLVASTMVLAACSKPGAANGAASAAGAPAAGARAAAPVAVSATDMPSMKPGLWEIHMAHTGREGAARTGVVQQCMNAEDMARAKTTASDYVKANCSKNEISHFGDTWTDILVCKMAGSTMTTRTVTAMNGDVGYHTELTTAYDPPVAGMANSGTTMDGKWLGACKA